MMKTLASRSFFPSGCHDLKLMMLEFQNFGLKGLLNQTSGFKHIKRVLAALHKLTIAEGN